MRKRVRRMHTVVAGPGAGKSEVLTILHGVYFQSVMITHRDTDHLTTNHDHILAVYLHDAAEFAPNAHRARVRRRAKRIWSIA
jgi:hypothetical protein